MSEHYRIVIETFSSTNKHSVERKVIKEDKIKSPHSIMDLGFRHSEQIEILQEIQNKLLQEQSITLKSPLDKCPQCGGHVRLNGVEPSDFHSVFTDHRVNVHRLKCGKCDWNKVSSIESLFGTSVHPDLAKMQCETGVNHSFRTAQKILNLQSNGIRKINNHDRIKKVIDAVGSEIKKELQRPFKLPVNHQIAKELILQVDGGHLKSDNPEQLSFEALTSVIYRPENLKKKGERGFIESKQCAASALDDELKTIKRNTLIAAKKQGLSTTTHVTALCDGAQNCWSVVDAIKSQCGSLTTILDWFHLSMKFQNTAMPPEHKNKLIRIKWHLWRGHADRALIRLLELKESVDIKYKPSITTLQTYIENNKTRIVDYRTRYKNGEAISSQMAESTVESLINQRCKGKQHMRWSRHGVHCILQVRAAIASNDWENNWEKTILNATRKVA